MRNLNKFEQAAHDIQPRKPRPSFDHKIETYTSGEDMGLLEWGIVAILALAVLIIVFEFVGGADALINLAEQHA